MPQNETEKSIFTAARPFEKVKVTKICPSCSSVFITEKECESCGLQFWVDLIGEPFGERSFFVMKDDFILNSPFYLKYLPRKIFLKRSATHKYKRALLKRFELLTEYFFDRTEEDISKRKAFLFEASKIIEEYGEVGGSGSALWALVDRGEKHPLAPQLYNSLRNSELVVGSGKKANFLQLFSNGLLVEFLFSIVAVVIASFLVFKYLNTH